MTLDLSKISRISLECVRQNHGYKPDDESGDAMIAAMSPRDFVASYSAWHLSTGSWGRQLYDLAHEVDAALKV